MLGAFVGGGKYSLSCLRAVDEKGFLEVRPGCRFSEQLVHGLRNAVCEPSTAFCRALESFVTALLFVRETTVGFADAYMNR